MTLNIWILLSYNHRSCKPIVFDKRQANFQAYLCVLCPLRWCGKSHSRTTEYQALTNLYMSLSGVSGKPLNAQNNKIWAECSILSSKTPAGTFRVSRAFEQIAWKFSWDMEWFKKWLMPRLPIPPFFCIMSEDKISGRKWLKRAPMDILGKGSTLNGKTSSLCPASTGIRMPRTDKYDSVCVCLRNSIQEKILTNAKGDPVEAMWVQISWSFFWISRKIQSNCCKSPPSSKGWQMAALRKRQF